MIIDENKYALSSDNYVEIETPKKIIIIGHTGNRDMRHVIGWKHRYNKKYKRTAAFTIASSGQVYKHFNPRYHSRYFNNVELDSKAIVILLENEGWLTKDIVNNELITWNGDIYKQPKDIVIRNWRGQTLWAPYSEEQVKSAIELVKLLCDEFDLPINLIGHNTKLDDLLDNSSVIYRSNLNKHYTDLSPAWDCKIFKESLENN